MRASKIYWVLWLYTTGPILISLGAGVVCLALGYHPDEGGMRPYVVFGFDIGGVLSGLTMAVFFAVFTIPTGLLAIVAFRVLLRWHRRRIERR